MTKAKILFANAAQQPYYDEAAYDAFLDSLSKLEAVLGAWNVGPHEGDGEFAEEVIAAADKLPLDVVLRDLSAIVNITATSPQTPFSRAIDTYIDSRVKHHSFADNFAALVYYDMINDDKHGAYSDLVNTYAARALTAFRASGSLEAQVTALDHVYAINEDPNASATDIHSLPMECIKVLKEAFVGTANLLLGVCRTSDDPAAPLARRTLTERLEMAETIHGAAQEKKLGGFYDLVHTIEGMYLEDLPPDAFADGLPFKIDPAADGPKPV